MTWTILVVNWSACLWDFNLLLSATKHDASQEEASDQDNEDHNDDQDNDYKVFVILLDILNIIDSDGYSFNCSNANVDALRWNSSVT